MKSITIKKYRFWPVLTVLLFQLPCLASAEGFDKNRFFENTPNSSNLENSPELIRETQSFSAYLNLQNYRQSLRSAETVTAFFDPFGKYEGHWMTGRSHVELNNSNGNQFGHGDIAQLTLIGIRRLSDQLRIGGALNASTSTIDVHRKSFQLSMQGMSGLLFYTRERSRTTLGLTLSQNQTEMNETSNPAIKKERNELFSLATQYDVSPKDGEWIFGPKVVFTKGYRQRPDAFPNEAQHSDYSGKALGLFALYTSSTSGISGNIALMSHMDSIDLFYNADQTGAPTDSDETNTTPAPVSAALDKLDVSHHLEVNATVSYSPYGTSRLSVIYRMFQSKDTNGQGIFIDLTYHL